MPDVKKNEKKPEEEPHKSPVNVVPKSTTPEPEQEKLLSLYEKHKLRKCSIRWKNITLKCAGPKCGLISSNHVYVAQIASSTIRPRYIILCERHRDVTAPDIYDYLSQRCGEIISLRKDPIPIDESDAEISEKESLGQTEDKRVRNKALTELPPLRETTKSPVVMASKGGTKRKSSNEDSNSRKKMNVEQTSIDNTGNEENGAEKTVEPESRGRGRKTRSTGPVSSEELVSNNELEGKRPILKKNDTVVENSTSDLEKTPHWSTIFKRNKSSSRNTRRRRGRPFKHSRPTSSASDSVSNDTFPPEPETESPTSAQPEEEGLPDDLPPSSNDDTECQVICVDSDSNEDPPVKPTESANVLLERNCCIPGCKQTTDSIIKVGEAPNFEYLVVCLIHRDCFKNVHGMEPIASSFNKPPKRGEYILEEGEVPPSPPTPEHMLDEETVSNVEKTSSGESYCFPPPINSSPMRGETIPVQRVRPTVLNSKDAVELNGQGQMLVSRKCISMTGPSGVPKSYILEEWGDGSIIYTPAPSGLPLGNCTKEQIAFYKMRQTQAENTDVPRVATQRSEVRAPSLPSTSSQDSQILSRHHIVTNPANPNPHLPIADVSKSELVYIQGQPFLLTSIQGLGGNVQVAKTEQDYSSNLTMQQQQQTASQRRVIKTVTQTPRPGLPPASSSSSRPPPIVIPKISSVTSSNMRTIPQSRTSSSFASKNSSSIKGGSPFVPRQLGRPQTQQLKQTIQSNIHNRVGSLSLPKNLSVRLMNKQQLQDNSQVETIVSDIDSSNDATEPEQILSDPVPIALTRVLGQGPAQSLQITQKTLQKPGNSGRLPQKPTANNQNILFSFVQNADGSAKLTPSPVQQRSLYTPQTARSSNLPQKSTPAPTTMSQKHKIVPPILDNSQVRVVLPKQIAPTSKSFTPIPISMKSYTARPGPASVSHKRPIQKMTLSAPRSVGRPPSGAKPPIKIIQEKRKSESPPPVRVTRHSSQTTPPKRAPELKATSSSETSNVIKIINLNKDTTIRKVVNDDINRLTTTRGSPFSLPVTTIAAVEDDEDDFDVDIDGSDSSFSDTQNSTVPLQNDSEDPSDPLSVKTVATIDLDECDPLGEHESEAPVSRTTSSSSGSGISRRGSLPFPSSIRKRQ